MDILDQFINEFGIYKSDITYYKKIISIYSADAKKVKEHILIDIKKDWTNYYNNWFIDFANNATIDEILSVIKKFKLELNPIVVQDIVGRCSNLDSYLKENLAKHVKWKDEDFEKCFSNSVLYDLMYNYAIIHDALDLGLDDIKYAKEVDYDAVIGNSTKTYIREIKNLQDFEHNYERIVKYHELKKLAKATEDPELKKKYDKEILKLRNLIIESNLCLVLPIANKYRNSDVDYLELIQEGSIGIIETLERFDPSKPYTFSTYAMWWIRQMVTRYIMMTSRTIRVPVHLYEQYNKVLRAQEDLKNELYRNPTEEEIAAKLGWPKNQVVSILKSFEMPISLDSPVKSDTFDDESPYYSVVADEHDYDEDIYKSEFIAKYMATANPRQNFIIRMRYGLSDGKDPRFDRPHTLDEVGTELGLTRERVRQIEAKFINSIRDKEHINVVHYSNKKNCYFWEFFEGVDKARIYEKMQYLSEDDLNKLYAKYGEDLNDFNWFESYKNNRVFSVINKIRRMLKDPNYYPKYYNGMTGKREAKSIFKYTGQYLRELTNRNIDEIRKCLFKTTSSYALLTRVFGLNLDKPASDQYIESFEIEPLTNIINSLANHIYIQDNDRTLREIIECSDEDFANVLKQLESKTNYIALLKTIFGDNYQNRADFYLLSQKDYLTWLNILSSIKNKLAKIEIMRIYSGGRSLEAILGKSEEETQLIVDELNPTTKIYSIVHKVINKEGLTYTEKTLFDHWCSRMRHKDGYGKKGRKKEIVNLEFVLESLKIDEEEFKKIYDGMQDNTMIYSKLTKLINGTILDEKDASLVRAWLSLMTYNDNCEETISLPDTNNKRKLLINLQIKESELLMNISNIHPGSIRYRAIMKYLNEDNLDEKEASAFATWKVAIKKVYSKTPEVLLKEKHERVEAPKSIEQIKDIVKTMPQTMSHVVELRLGLFDGSIYSYNEISEMYDMDPAEVKKIYDEGIVFIQNSTIGKDIAKLTRRV